MYQKGETYFNNLSTFASRFWDCVGPCCDIKVAIMVAFYTAIVDELVYPLLFGFDASFFYFYFF